MFYCFLSSCFYQYLQFRLKQFHRRMIITYSVNIPYRHQERAMELEYPAQLGSRMTIQVGNAFVEMMLVEL